MEGEGRRGETSIKFKKIIIISSWEGKNKNKRKGRISV